MPVTLQWAWGFSLALEAMLAIRVRIASRRSAYPLFFWYLVADVVLSSAMFVIADIYPAVAYRMPFLVYGPLMSVLLLVVCLEAMLKMNDERPVTGVLLAWSFAWAGTLTLAVLVGMGQVRLSYPWQLPLPFKAGISTLSALLLGNLARVHVEHCEKPSIAARHAWMLVAYLAVHAVYYLSILEPPNLDVPMMVVSCICWVAWMFIW